MLGGLRLNWRRAAATAGIATLIGVFLGLVGPFGNFLNGSLAQRVAYWVGSVWAGTLIYAGAAHLVLRVLPSGWRATAGLALTVALVSVPYALASRSVAIAIWPELAGIPAARPIIWYLEVLLLTTPQVAAFALWWRHRTRATPAEPPAQEGLGVLPAQVLCLQMEDHYVRVHTAGGSRLVLATLAQAIGALKGAAGLQTHRSWWVAEKAVVRVIADGRNLRLELANGVTAPVARSSVAAVRAAGWLDR